jgi:diguanylate cyclase (GGDEF)-like protein
MAGAILISYAVFGNSYLEQRNQIANVMIQSIRNELADVSYALSKTVKDVRDIKQFKALLDRTAANNDLVDAILVSQGSRVLLVTDPSYAVVPAAEDIALDPSNVDLAALLSKTAIAASVRFYQSDKPTRLDVLFFVDQDYVRRRLSTGLSEFLYWQGLAPLAVLVVLWLFLHKAIVQPFRRLQLYAHSPAHLPLPFTVKELESLRQTLTATYSRLQQEKNELYRLSTTDDLCGLANRNSLNEHLLRLIAACSRQRSEFAVVFLDLDNFKSVNDTLGHKAGDLLLGHVANALKVLLRGTDFIARVGGDEFVIVLGHYKDRVELLGVLDRVLTRMKEPWSIGESHFYLSVSMGVAFYPNNGTDPGMLLKNADIAMYEAKRSGRSRYRFFSDALNKAIVDEVELDREMRRALLRGEFEVYFQPKAQVDSNRITGAEALLRWNHPLKGLLTPAVFIHIADRSGFIVELGQWILRQAMAQQVAWREADLCDISISVNISPMQLYDKEFYEYLARSIRDCGIDPGKLDIEITESIFLENTDKNLELLKAIHATGVTISLDDFGTGYSSLAYLKRFPIDTLKIDKSFVDDFGTKSGAIFLNTIVTMGKTLNMQVVAEGVETETQKAYLRSIGCDLYQGYLCSRPVTATEFQGLFRRHSSLGGNVVSIERSR